MYASLKNTPKNKITFQVICSRKLLRRKKMMLNKKTFQLTLEEPKEESFWAPPGLLWL